MLPKAPHAAVIGLLTATFMATTPAHAETVHGVVVFTRHGDRTTKHYGAQQLTSLGSQQNFHVGSVYRSRYLSSTSPHQIHGISADKYVSSQVYASAPDQSILLNTATAFLQGLYPPLVDLNASVASTTLNNGSSSTSPLNGYQYVVLHGQNADAPDAIWIKGDDGCPANAAAGKTFFDSASYKSTLASTRDFYTALYPTVQDVYDYRLENMSYKNAYDIFDLINVARIHNASSTAARAVSEQTLFQLRTLADSAEWGYNFNASQPARSIHARTLAAGLLRQLNQTVTGKAALKFSLLAGSYDTFMTFFGLANLTSLSGDFFGLPEYASTMAFELFSDTTASAAFPADPNAELKVRFLFRNGTDGELGAWPLFGLGQEALAWPKFRDEMQARSIGSAAEWCDVCESELSFCAAFRDGQDGTTASSSGGSAGSGGMSNAVAGVIGAVVALAVVAIVGGAVFLVIRRWRQGAAARRAGSGSGSVAGESGAGFAATHEKSSVKSGSV